MQKTRKGFTLVELVVVIAVIAILAGVLIGTFASVINKANASAKAQEIKQQEIEQKATDILKKLEESNWLGWEDFEANLVAKLTEVYEKTPTASITSEEVKKAVNDAFTTYMAAHQTETTGLTEKQVKAIIENALGTLDFSGVTEAQVKAIVTAATATIPSTAQIKQIVTAANANNLTANDVAKIVAENSASSIDDITAAITTATSTLATSEDVQKILDSLTADASNNVIIAKALNIKLSQNGLSTVSYPYEVVSAFGEDSIKTTDTTSTILLYIDPTTKAPTFVVKDSTGFVYEAGLTTSNIDDIDLWKFATVVDTTYSTYLLKTSTVANVPDLTTGLDVGENDEVTEITYKGNSSNKAVVIRTNGGTLTVEAPLDTVNHYGKANLVNVNNIAKDSYHENGTVELIAVKEGHVSLESESKVDNLHFVKKDDTSFNTMILSLADGAKVPELSKDPVPGTEDGVLVAEVKQDSTSEYIMIISTGDVVVSSSKTSVVDVTETASAIAKTVASNTQENTKTVEETKAEAVTTTIKTFAELQAYINSSTVKGELGANFDLTSALLITSDKVLNLAGYTLTNKFEAAYPFMVYGASFTINGEKDGVKGKIIVPESNTSVTGLILLTNSSFETMNNEKVFLNGVEINGYYNNTISDPSPRGGLVSTLEQGSNQVISIENCLISYNELQISADKSTETTASSLITGSQGTKFIVKNSTITFYSSQLSRRNFIHCGGDGYTEVSEEYDVIIEGNTVYTNQPMLNISENFNCLLKNNTYGAPTGSDWKKNAICTSYGSKVTVVNGNYEASNAVRMYSSGGTIIINGGNFKGSDSVLYADGSNNNADQYPAIINVFGGNFDGKIIATGTKNEEATITIEGGNFINFTVQLTANLYSHLVIKGGTFDADPSAYVDANNYNVTENAGIWTVTAK